MDNLIKPSNYAKYYAYIKGKSVVSSAYIYKLLNQGKLKKFEIDTVPFVFLEGDVLKDYKQCNNLSKPHF